MPEKLTAAAEHIAAEVAGLREDVRAETRTRKIQNGILTAALVLVVVGLVAVFLNFRTDARDRDRTVEGLCAAVTDNRDLLDAVVHVAYADDGGGALDLSAFPAYASLPPETRAWVDQLNAVLNSPPPSQPDGNDDGVPDAINDLLDEVTC